VGHEPTSHRSLQRGRAHGRSLAGRDLTQVSIFLICIRKKKIIFRLTVHIPPCYFLFSFKLAHFLVSDLVQFSILSVSFSISFLFFRYMLGVYELQQRIVTAFPNILLENCASGGGRFDPGTALTICFLCLFTVNDDQC